MCVLLCYTTYYLSSYLYYILYETWETFLEHSSECKCCKAFTSGEEAKSVYDAGMIKHSTSSDLYQTLLQVIILFIQ